ncbi:hypothetical protein Q4601_06945 [Shewanella sp. 1_MG-2023]|uniref:hypothetical protein n=1 Tax=unclassified Shewanella TaxID=196818 RepID=UPI0026E48707|nr:MULTISPECIES: hypothetical protein [unclassified Shewanella]MDO6612279.1 hypothetical protein [Shewanella sp. 7_MG-2023]MDO6772133.1 hypothetical protein [Shewanella sp. 2_MG-2023]MDO6794039.1 hypothetical protein [Shewanella sp. 1_MG-2023]
MSQYIRLFSEMSLMAGLIGHFEYIERHEIADWLEDFNGRVPDPRVTSDENSEPLSEESSEENNSDERQSSATEKHKYDDPPWLELLMMNQWMFTLGDADCYPSVPHGHYKSKTREWPKLNPYTGRAFSDVHREDVSKRLSKKDMIKLWNDSKFIEHCREQVLWYSYFSSSYGFPNARRGKLAFPRWK